MDSSNPLLKCFRMNHIIEIIFSCCHEVYIPIIFFQAAVFQNGQCVALSLGDCGKETVNVKKKRKQSKLPLVPFSRHWQMAQAEHMVLAVKQNLYLHAVCIFNQEYELWYKEACPSCTKQGQDCSQHSRCGLQLLQCCDVTWVTR